MEIDTLVYVHNCSVCWKGCVSSEARVICAHTQPWQGKGGLPTKLLIVIMIQTRSSTKGEFPNRPDTSRTPNHFTPPILCTKAARVYYTSKENHYKHMCTHTDRLPIMLKCSLIHCMHLFAKILNDYMQLLSQPRICCSFNIRASLVH